MESSTSKDSDSTWNSVAIVKAVSILLTEIITENKAELSKKGKTAGMLVYLFFSKSCKR